MAIKKSSVSVDDIEDVVVKKKPASSAVAKKDTPAKKSFPAKKAVTRNTTPRPPPVRFDSPSDFKPFFLQIDFRTGADGLLSPEGFEVIRFKGRWDNEAAKTFNMSEYDVPTLVAIMSRVSAVTYAPNSLRRLPANTSWSIIGRVGKRAADGSLMFGIKAGKASKDGDAEGKKRWYKDATNIAYRKIRRITRVIPSAFVVAQLPPTGRRSKSAEVED